MTTAINYSGAAYRFLRDLHTQEGLWYVISGRCPALLGHENGSVSVPLEYGAELTLFARESGVTEAHNFFRYPPQPPPPPKREKSAEPRKPKSSIVGKGIKLNILMDAVT